MSESCFVSIPCINAYMLTEVEKRQDETDPDGTNAYPCAPGRLLSMRYLFRSGWELGLFLENPIWTR